MLVPDTAPLKTVIEAALLRLRFLIHKFIGTGQIGGASIPFCDAGIVGRRLRSGKSLEIAGREEPAPPGPLSAIDELSCYRKTGNLEGPCVL
jgi:hypothetical protein